jgi:hypothetical protein
VPIEAAAVAEYDYRDIHTPGAGAGALAGIVARRA